MFKHRLKKYTVFLFTILFLVLLLNMSINNINVNTFDIFAANKSSSTSTKSPYSGSDMAQVLAKLINGEAMGEPYQGQVAVGAVVLNRVKSSKFPNTILAVIYQKGQFSCVTDGNFNKAIPSNSTAYKAAKEAMDGADPTNGALYFYNPKTAKSKWLYSLKTLKTIANHRFAAGV